MLEFIILGRIPGTDVRLSFLAFIDVVMLSIAITLVLFDLKIVHKRHTQQTIAAATVAVTIHQRLEQLTQHISAVLRVQIDRVKTNAGKRVTRSGA